MKRGFLAVNSHKQVSAQFDESCFTMGMDVPGRNVEGPREELLRREKAVLAKLSEGIKQEQALDQEIANLTKIVKKLRSARNSPKSLTKTPPRFREKILNKHPPTIELEQQPNDLPPQNILQLTEASNRVKVSFYSESNGK